MKVIVCCYVESTVCLVWNGEVVCVIIVQTSWKRELSKSMSTLEVLDHQYEQHQNQCEIRHISFSFCLLFSVKGRDNAQFRAMPCHAMPCPHHTYSVMSCIGSNVHNYLNTNSSSLYTKLNMAPWLQHTQWSFATWKLYPSAEQHFVRTFGMILCWHVCPWNAEKKHSLALDHWFRRLPVDVRQSNFWDHQEQTEEMSVLLILCAK